MPKSYDAVTFWLDKDFEFLLLLNLTPRTLPDKHYAHTGVPFMLSPSKAALSQGKLTCAGTYRNGRRA